MTENKIFMGIDVSKETLDISLNQKHYKIANSEKGIKGFIDKHSKLLRAVKLCALEATGRYEVLVMTMLQKHGLPVHRANPLHVKNFARASNQKAKTDKIDAYLLEKYAIFVQDTENGDPVITDTYVALQQLRTVERSLEDELHGHKCRLAHFSGVAKKITDKQINACEKQLIAVRTEIDRVIKADAKLHTKKQAMLKVKGIGSQIANVLICDMPELGTMTAKQVVSLTGVAPFTKQSGKSTQQSHIQGGRFYVRKALYMAALVCIKHSPILREVYERLKGAGKPSKVALVAVMRKIIIFINTLMREVMSA